MNQPRKQFLILTVSYPSEGDYKRSQDILHKTIATGLDDIGWIDAWGVQEAHRSPLERFDELLAANTDLVGQNRVLRKTIESLQPQSVSPGLIIGVVAGAFATCMILAVTAGLIVKGLVPIKVQPQTEQHQ